MTKRLIQTEQRLSRFPSIEGARLKTFAFILHITDILNFLAHILITFSEMLASSLRKPRGQVLRYDIRPCLCRFHHTDFKFNL